MSWKHSTSGSSALDTASYGLIVALSCTSSCKVFCFFTPSSSFGLCIMSLVQLTWPWVTYSSYSFSSNTLGLHDDWGFLRTRVLLLVSFFQVLNIFTNIGLPFRLLLDRMLKVSWQFGPFDGQNMGLQVMGSATSIGVLSICPCRCELRCRFNGDTV